MCEEVELSVGFYCLYKDKLLSPLSVPLKLVSGMTVCLGLTRKHLTHAWTTGSTTHTHTQDTQDSKEHMLQKDSLLGDVVVICLLWQVSYYSLGPFFPFSLDLFPILFSFFLHSFSFTVSKPVVTWHWLHSNKQRRLPVWVQFMDCVHTHQVGVIFR